ncbi:glucokinase [Microcella putealis]|uniref:Glucokinase n=1 Tax=Microcella putealis TaxID=337005 RepID=A0A4Q7LWX5_9MICO|nr:ROK family protein [Microcella putealis]RZS59063.1 glucokinase [Microcella putealis]TQM24089.1 glucokinase [Microcella putealis]
MTDYALAVDLGGTKVEAALVAADGSLVAGSRHRRPTGATATSDELARSVTEAVQDALATLVTARRDDRVIGVGIGSAGPLVGSDGHVSPLNLPAWRGYPLGDLVTSLVPDVPVVTRIDGIAITLAETWVGAARGERNVMGMVVSTGVGGGLLVDGRTIAGPSGNAGHIGHVQVAGHDDRCACGARGCLEAVASGPRTVAWARREGWQGETGEELAASARAGDPIARAAIERSATAVGEAIASTSALLDLDVVAIGGGFSHVADDYIDIVARTVAGHSDFAFVTSTRVVRSGLSGEGPLIGAAALVHHSEQLS